MKKIRVYVFVSGKVQGVFYRANTEKVAEKLGVCGWVKNLPNGKVEVLAEGYESKINKLIDWMKKGPDLSRVDKLEVKWDKYKGEFKGFEIRC